MSTPTRITHLVDGTSWEGTAERTSPVFNPATGEQTGVLDLASADLVGEVVAHAKAEGSASAASAGTTEKKSETKSDVPPASEKPGQSAASPPPAPRRSGTCWSP